MALSMAHLLVHSDGIPSQARRALRRALRAAGGDRTKHLEEAAQVLWRQTDLQCAEVRDLIAVA